MEPKTRETLGCIGKIVLYAVLLGMWVYLFALSMYVQNGR